MKLCWAFSLKLKDIFSQYNWVILHFFQGFSQIWYYLILGLDENRVSLAETLSANLFSKAANW